MKTIIKLKTLLFTLLAIASSAFTMEKPSWFASMRQKNTQQKELYKEVKEIVKSGSTVKEVEAKKLREKHVKALEEFKQCAEMTSSEWQTFKELLATSKEKNPLFNVSTYSSEDETYEDETSHPVQALAHHILKERNLNPQAVDIELITEQNKDASSQYFNDAFGQTSNLLVLSTPTPNFRKHSQYAIGHEIAHLQEHHPLECDILAHLSEKNLTDPCFKPLRYQQEYGADALSALENYPTAQNAFESSANFYAIFGLEVLGLDHYKHPTRENSDHTDLHPIFNWPLYQKVQFIHRKNGESHPSTHSRAEKLKRIASMLKIEGNIRTKEQEKAALSAQLWKHLKYAFNSFKLD